MSTLVAVLLVIAAILLFGGLFIEAVKFLVWVAIALAVVAVIVWLIRYIRGRAST